MNIHDEISPTQAYWMDEDTEWEEVQPGLKRKIEGYDGKIMLVKAKFEVGAEGYLHKHYHSQVTYVASGEFRMTIGDEVRIIKEGDSYYIPPHVMHGCVCTKPGVLIDIFSPAREDFLGHDMLEEGPTIKF